MKRILIAIVVCLLGGAALAQTPPTIPGEVIGGWEFNLGPGKGNWTAEKNRAEYPTLRDCELALMAAMKNVPLPWPLGVQCAPYRVQAPKK